MSEHAVLGPVDPGADILQLGALELLLEPTVVVGEAVQHRGHPPGEVLGAPNPPQAQARVLAFAPQTDTR
jgi:hypothetical protein